MFFTIFISKLVVVFLLHYFISITSYQYNFKFIIIFHHMILFIIYYLLFIGYENADWFIPSPALKSVDTDLKLSPDQIRETLNYFSK